MRRRVIVMWPRPARGQARAVRLMALRLSAPNAERQQGNAMKQSSVQGMAPAVRPMLRRPAVRHVPVMATPVPSTSAMARVMPASIRLGMRVQSAVWRRASAMWPRRARAQVRPVRLMALHPPAPNAKRQQGNAMKQSSVQGMAPTVRQMLRRPAVRHVPVMATRARLTNVMGSM